MMWLTCIHGNMYLGETKFVYFLFFSPQYDILSTPKKHIYEFSFKNTETDILRYLTII